MSDAEHTEGVLHDTYHAALQHNHVEPDEDDLVLGVVREPMYGIHTFLDDNYPVLAPTLAALREFKERADEIGHNEAVEELDFDSRYRELIRSEEEAQEAMQWIVSELEDGRDVWLVCYENTDDKFCHRCVLKEEIGKMRNEVTAGAC